MSEADVQRLFRSHKFIIYAVVFFLAFITYLLILVGQRLSSDQALQTQSQAYNTGFATQRAREIVGQNLAQGENMQMENESLTVEDSSTDVSSCSESVMAAFYRAKRDVNGNEIVGCVANAYCNPGPPFQSSGTVECSYDGTLLERRNFNSNRCDKAECHAKALQLCGCVEPPADPGSAGAPVPTATPTPVPVAGSCEDTIIIDYFDKVRDNSGKCGGISNTRANVGVTCRKPDGSQVFCNIRDNKNRCIDPSKLGTDLLKQACCGCSSGNYYYIDIDTDLTP